LEDPGPWGRDALRDARLPERVGLELQRRCRAAGVRPLLIRRASSNASAAAPSSGGLACFAIRSGPEPPWIEHIRLESVADTLGVDLPALGRGLRLGLEPVDGPLFLVCTLGRRDVCCAERGRPVAQALATAVPGATWESSHVGGDRFAGNLVAFPHGLYLGRVRPDEAAEVARAYANGRVSLRHLRGRSCYPMPVQAAEHALRTHEGFDRVDDVGLERSERRRGVTTSTFRTPMGRFSVSVAIEESAPSFLTCHSHVAEPAPAYRTIAIIRRPDLDVGAP
ncbi:MAG TPA: sucrase ferredoxin, partial [Actinomycetota bacterium]|nr:sucrase ferredoxin [Actinomycetota bacterium]